MAKVFRNIALSGVGFLMMSAAAPAVVVGGAVLMINSAAQNTITTVRSLREISDEEDGDCFCVYYPF